jgi:hypothetical protein
MRWSNISVSFKLFVHASLEDAGVAPRGVEQELLLKSFMEQGYACESNGMFGCFGFCEPKKNEESVLGNSLNIRKLFHRP